MGLLYSAMEEGLGGIRIIKAFHAQKFINKSFEEINLRYQKLITRAFRKRDLSPLLNETIGAGVMISLVWLGGSMILNQSENTLTGELFITFIIVFSQLLRPIQGFQTAWPTSNKSKASQDRINEILETDLKITNPKNPIKLSGFKDKIEYKNVGFYYKKDPVLKNINLSINKGESIALVGESGSGKSTIADLLPRFYDTIDGEVTFDGINIKKMFRSLNLKNKLELFLKNLFYLTRLLLKIYLLETITHQLSASSNLQKQQMHMHSFRSLKMDTKQQLEKEATCFREGKSSDCVLPEQSIKIRK